MRKAVQSVQHFRTAFQQQPRRANIFQGFVQRSNFVVGTNVFMPLYKGSYYNANISFYGIPSCMISRTVVTGVDEIVNGGMCAAAIIFSSPVNWIFVTNVL